MREVVLACPPSHLVLRSSYFAKETKTLNLTLTGERQLQTCTFEVLFAQGWPLFKISSHWACRWFLRQTSCSGWCMHQHWLSLSARPPERIKVVGPRVHHREGQAGTGLL
ncbi:hypothetical protein MRX96_034635 [Rhipicephalus microplus]